MAQGEQGGEEGPGQARGPLASGVVSRRTPGGDREGQDRQVDRHGGGGGHGGRTQVFRGWGGEEQGEKSPLSVARW